VLLAYYTFDMGIAVGVLDFELLLLKQFFPKQPFYNTL